ncbi:hypothetical protein JOD45_001977 [Scopulibacillus daqui]|uniref:Sporulation protein YhaL n=1 Tax=Scopulibacillus daqui TaxID=1469162 RepID=A0ABS2Q0P1_9BACL|nr:hypothetical protein [Scopulibacillus daqui]MBM7645758.1 hypothetical protein [Scopulibacillus daqui]
MTDFGWIMFHLVGGILAFLVIGVIIVGSEWFGSKKRKQEEKMHRENFRRKSVKPKPR